MRALLLSIILFCSIVFTAQTFEWAKILDHEEICSEEGQFVGADSMGNVYMIGEIICTVTGPNSYNYTTKLLIKFDVQGNKLWTDTIPSGGWKYAIDKSGNIFMAGSSYIRKLSGLDGSLIWSKQIINRYFRQISVTPENGVILSGMVYYNSSTDSSAYYKLDASGNVVWKRIGDFYPTAGHLPIKCTKEGDTYVLRQDNNYQTWVFHIDPSGTSTDLISLPQYTVLAYNQRMDVTDKIYVSATVSDFNPYFTTILSCYNKSGSLLWTENLTGKGIVEGMIHDELNNNYLVTAYRGNMQYKDSSFLSPVALGVIKINQQGDMIWTKFVKGPDGALSSLGCQISNNQCYLTGVIKKTFQFDNYNLTSTGEFGGDMFIAKLNLPTTAVNIKEINSTLHTWQVYPNPATNYITVECKDELFITVTITLRNVLGQRLETIIPAKTEQGCTINLGKYPKGIYFVEINSEKGKEVKKVVLE